MKQIRSLSLVIWAAFCLIGVLGIPARQGQAAPSARAEKKAVDVNNADLKTLESLPGIGPSLAQRIVENRPYQNLQDLEKVKGLSKSKVEALKNQVSFGSMAARDTGVNTAKKEKAGTSRTTNAKQPDAQVNINTADEKTLETLPGIGPVLAQRIVEHRPYKNLADLEKVKGLSKSELTRISEQVTFGPNDIAAGGQPSRSTKVSPTQPNSDQTSPGAPTGRSAGQQPAPGEKININTANAQELDRLFGIGPVKAQAIIDYRAQHGNFQKLEDIMKVKGIKEDEFAKIKDQITVRQ